MLYLKDKKMFCNSVYILLCDFLCNVQISMKCLCLLMKLWLIDYFNIFALNKSSATMKSTQVYTALVFVCIMCCCGVMAQADTIDVYHVYYNNEVIRQFNQNDIGKKNVVEIEKVAIKETDTLTVSYWHDTPFDTCRCSLILWSPQYNIGFSIKGCGRGNDFKIALGELLAYSRKQGVFTFEVQYVEEMKFAGTLFIIQLL